jgi:hypothetical protein
VNIKPALCCCLLLISPVAVCAQTLDDDVLEQSIREAVARISADLDKTDERPTFELFPNLGSFLTRSVETLISKHRLPGSYNAHLIMEIESQSRRVHELQILMQINCDVVHRQMERLQKKRQGIKIPARESS